MNLNDLVFAQLEAALPPIFTREEAAKHMGGLFKAKTLNNIDSRGDGPTIRVRVGKKVAYERHSFVQWLRNYRPNLTNV